MDNEHDNTPDELALKAVHFGSEVKMRGDGSTVEGYLVQFGNPDEADFDGDYFTAETDFDVDWDEGGKSSVYFNHGLDPVVGKSKLGGGQKATLELKEQGVWISARLKEGETYDEMVKQLMQKRRTGWSSGVPAHLVERERVGNAFHVTKWSLGTDASITHIPNDWRNIATLKSLADELQQVTPEDGGHEETPTESEQGNVSPTKASSLQEEADMNEDQLKQLAGLVAAEVATTLKAQLSAEDAATAEAKAADELKQMAENKPEDEDEQAHVMKMVTSQEFTEKVAGIVNELQAVRNNSVASAVKSHLSNGIPQSQATGFRGQTSVNTRIEVRSKYADLSAQDMAYLYHMRKASAMAQGLTFGADNGFVREMLDKAQKSYGKGDLKLAPDSPSMKAMTELKANELDHSTQAGFGDEWVPDIHSADLWELTRSENVVLPRLRFIEMPSNPFELPVQSTDPTVYKVAETTAENQLTLADGNSPIPDSKIGTSKVTLTAAKLGLRTGWSMEAEEDSIIPFVSNARAQSLRAIQDAMDNVVINGDTATTLNINSDGESISDATRKYLVFNGLIKAPLVTTSTMSVNANGAVPTLSLMRQVRAKLRNAYATDLRNLMWIVDFSTYMKLLAIDEVSSAANRGSAPTGVTGVLGGIDGVDLFVSNEMALADTDGKVTQSANVTNTGRALLVHRPSWVAGYRRRVTSSLTFHPEYDAYQLVSTVRLALINRDTQATAILYNIGV